MERVAQKRAAQKRAVNFAAGALALGAALTSSASEAANPDCNTRVLLTGVDRLTASAVSLDGKKITNEVTIGGKRWLVVRQQSNGTAKIGDKTVDANRFGVQVGSQMKVVDVPCGYDGSVKLDLDFPRYIETPDSRIPAATATSTPRLPETATPTATVTAGYHMSDADPYIGATVRWSALVLGIVSIGGLLATGAAVVWRRLTQEPPAAPPPAGGPPPGP